MNILILNGPNLNLLGRREPHIYGTRSFDDFFPELQAAFPDLTLSTFQSNHEGGLLDSLHAAAGWGPGGSADARQAVVLNAGGFTHTSVALGDAVATVAGAGLPVVEVHLSNLAAREDFRHQSFIGKHCVGSIAGFGLESYRLALHYLLGQRPRPVGFGRR
ncbi:MAG: type II 3-dehydroquinate dehydratase [Janthinobacterium lividum]